MITTALIYFLIWGLYQLNNDHLGKPVLKQNETIEVTKGILIPAPAGNGECGTARFMTTKEMEGCFAIVVYDGAQIKGLKENCGIIVDYRKTGKKEILFYLDTPTNVSILGATRSGKTRRLLLTSLWLNILAGINLLLVDVKGEQYAVHRN